MSSFKFSSVVLSLACVLAVGPVAAQTQPAPKPGANDSMPTPGAKSSPSPLQPGDAFGEPVTLPERTIVYMKGHTNWDAAFDTLVDAFKSLQEYLDKQDVKPSGPPITIYTQTDDTGFSYQAGLPVTQAPKDPPKGDISIGPAPSGKALKFVHGQRICTCEVMTLSRFLPILLTAMLAFSTAQAAEKVVTVTGEATVSVPPDTAVIRIGVSSLEKTAREAGEANAKQMTAVLAAIKASGIAERDIQTSRLSLQPQYDPNKGGTRLTGFQANNQVTIRIRDIDSLPIVLDRAIAAGANEMSGIEFVVSEQSKLLDQARDEAIADARRKAELYAKAAGAKLGQVISISEEGTAPQPRAMQAVRAGAVPIAPGEQTLRAIVSVSYELTP